MYNKNNIAVGKVASRSNIRTQLECVAFYGDRTIATDSLRLIEMSAKGKKLDTPVLYFASDLKKLKLKKDETVDAKSIKIKPANIKGEEYPKVDSILYPEKCKDYIEVKVNAEYLADICTVLKTLDPFNQVTLKVSTSPHAPIVIVAQSKEKDGQTARALLMPINK